MLLFLSVIRPVEILSTDNRFSISVAISFQTSFSIIPSRLVSPLLSFTPWISFHAAFLRSLQFFQALTLTIRSLPFLNYICFIVLYFRINFSSFPHFPLISTLIIPKIFCKTKCNYYLTFGSFFASASHYMAFLFEIKIFYTTCNTKFLREWTIEKRLPPLEIGIFRINAPVLEQRRLF